ncbi:hypothetical protein Y032_0114g429 [Ancylostoma ceylanicum]|uniref:Uncharacterized protein n=1 Tax=Ancylostoma ceylanicum TaxID=53326 RepID=A0A016TD40_9BILA|nr:hypothetical protein Y032_0114g429 [Ancylostoma ceylanicum]
MPDDSTFSSVVPHFLFLLILAFVIDIGTSYLPDYKLLLNEESFSFSMLLQLLMMILSSMLALILLCSVALCGVASPVVQEQAASELVTILETHLLQTFC